MESNKGPMAAKTHLTSSPATKLRDDVKVISNINFVRDLTCSIMASKWQLLTAGCCWCCLRIGTKLQFPQPQPSNLKFFEHFLGLECTTLICACFLKQTLYITGTLNPCASLPDTEGDFCVGYKGHVNIWEVVGGELGKNILFLLSNILLAAMFLQRYVVSNCSK